MEISNILGEEYLKKFKIYNSELLFEPFWDNLKINRCPICGNKLKFARSKPIVYCNGKKHAKTFIIQLDRLNKIKDIDYIKVKSLPIYKNM